MSPNKNLIVVGSGELGCRVAALWKQSHPDATITLKTRSYKKEREDKWRAAGFCCLSDKDKHKKGEITAPYVVFSAPPSGGRHGAGSSDYTSSAAKAIANYWKMSDVESGAFIFTSSGGVYTENAGGTVDEASNVRDGPNQILDAEKAVMEKGGSVIRFGGLYTSGRGAHNYWLPRGTAESSSCGLINLIHYDDAASAVVRALEVAKRRSLLLLADGNPISRLDICRAALEHPKFRGMALPTFTGEPVVDGKKYDTSKAKRELSGWQPKFESFAKFMTELHGDEKPCELLSF